MNLDMLRPRNETEDLLLSRTKNYETLIKQTHTKPQRTLEYKLIEPKQTFFSNHQSQLKDKCWMV